jgi:hypothetical protein
MRKLTTAICAVAATVMAPPAFAQTASTAAFDGAYAGVSRRVEGGPMGSGNTRACPLPDGVPAPLTIANGVARGGAADNPMEGSVTPQGVLVMRTRNGSGKFEGQIDAQGKAVGRITISCSYQLVWQRR